MFVLWLNHSFMQDIESLHSQLSSERTQRVTISERIIQLEKASEGMVSMAS